MCATLIMASFCQITKTDFSTVCRPDHGFFGVKFKTDLTLVCNPEHGSQTLPLCATLTMYSLCSTLMFAALNIAEAVRCDDASQSEQLVPHVVQRRRQKIPYQ